MKANVPDKIYVKITHPISDEYTEMIAFEDGDGIEYTRTDAFIEKAIKYVTNHFLAPGMDNKIEDFKNFLKGE